MAGSTSSETKIDITRAFLGRGGPVAGSIISILGNLLVLIGFVLPWASCSGYQASGLDLVQQSASGRLGDTSGTLLALIPFLAVGMIGVAILTIPAALWRKIPTLIKTVGVVLIALMTVCACLPAGLFFTNMQSARNSPDIFGLGGFIRVEYGFWVSVFGLLLSLVGGLVGIGTAAAEMLMRRKKPPA
jgi:hypothetical protein